MATYPTEQRYALEVQEKRPVRSTFLSDPFIVAVPVRELSWWEKMAPERRLITGKSYLYLKRAFDLALAILLLPILAPIMGICAVLIKIESPGGPIMFKQKRTGEGGRRFYMYKFRTMVPNAEEIKKELAHLNILQPPDFKIPDDPRITRVGKFLRKTSVDEFPQILNILSGEMSFVGPRPTSFAARTYNLWHTERLDVTPGLTGLWQIYGRGTMEFDDRVRLDVAYIERRSLLLDFLILVHTAFAVLKRKGAV